MKFDRLDALTFMIVGSIVISVSLMYELQKIQGLPYVSETITFPLLVYFVGTVCFIGGLYIFGLRFVDRLQKNKIKNN